MPSRLLGNNQAFQSRGEHCRHAERRLARAHGGCRGRRHLVHAFHSDAGFSPWRSRRFRTHPDHRFAIDRGRGSDIRLRYRRERVCADGASFRRRRGRTWRSRQCTTPACGLSCEGIVSWDISYLVASVVLSVVFAGLALHAALRRTYRDNKYVAVGLLVLAIVSLHFTGMTAFRVEPMMIDGSLLQPRRHAGPCACDRRRSADHRRSVLSQAI